MAKKKSNYEELPTKVCPNCNELCMEEAEVCDACGYSFVEPSGQAQEPTPEEAVQMEDLFSGLEVPGENKEEVPVVEEPEEEVTLEDISSDVQNPPDLTQEYISLPEEDLTLDETPAEESAEEPTEEVPEPPEGKIFCPGCGEIIDEDATFCPTCAFQLKEEEVKPKAPLQDIPGHYVIARAEDVDYSKAVAGEDIIVRKVGDKYEALMYPFEQPMKVLDVDEKEAEMLKADYTLRVVEDINVKDVVEAGFTLQGSKEYLQKYFGTTNIDDIYGEGLSEYAGVRGIKDELLSIGLPIDVMQTLTKLKPTEQGELAKILNDYNITDLTPTSAMCIVDSDRSGESMKDIVVRDKMLQSMVSDLISQKLAQ